MDRRPLFLASSALILLTGAIGAPLNAQGWRREEGGTSFDEALVSALQRHGGYDDFLAMVRAMPNVAAARQQVTQLTRRGLLRLAPTDQLRRVQLLSQLLAILPTSQCAAYARGRLTYDQAAMLLQSLDQASITAFANLVAKALLAELRETPASQPATEAEISTFFDQALSELRQDERDRLVAAVESLESATDDEVCWVNRTLYRIVLAKHGAQGTRAIRIVTTLEVQAGEMR